MANIKEILEERGTKYGEFNDHAYITQNIKNTMRHSVSWRDCTFSMQEALDMVAHKIGRIVNGDPNYLDSWVDIQGYVALVIAELEAQNDVIIEQKSLSQKHSKKL